MTAAKADAEANGAAAALENAYLKKVGEQAPFYAHIEGLLTRYFDFMGVEGASG